MGELDRGRLIGRWLHAREEDSGGRSVFRPEDADLPPARGRRSLELRDDGSYTESAPGPDDRVQSRGGSWTVGGADRIELEGEGGRSLRVVSLDDGRLVVEE